MKKRFGFILAAALILALSLSTVAVAHGGGAGQARSGLGVDASLRFIKDGQATIWILNSLADPLVDSRVEFYQGSDYVTVPVWPGEPLAPDEGRNAVADLPVWFTDGSIWFSAYYDDGSGAREVRLGPWAVALGGAPSLTTTYDSGWLTVETGETVEVPIPEGRVIGAQVRWRGREVASKEYKSASVSTSGSAYYSYGKSFVFPPVPAGYSLDHVTGRASASDTYVRVSVFIGSASAEREGFGSASVSLTQSSGTAALCQAYADYFTYTFTAITVGYKLVYSQTGQCTVSLGGVDFPGPASLANGEVSDWYPVTGVADGVTNHLLLTIDGSGQADFEVQVEYQEGLSLRLLEPLGYGRVARDSLVFRGEVSGPVGHPATTYFPRVYADRGDPPNWSDPECDWDSRVDPTGWDYYDTPTHTWQPMPVGGIPVGEQCRFTPPASGAGVAIGPWKWRARAWDAETNDWGPWSDVNGWYNVQAVASRYYLEVNGIDVTGCASNIKVSLTTNGEQGALSWDHCDPSGGAPPADGDDVTLGIRDVTGSTELYYGKVVGTPSFITARTYGVLCKLADSILAERYCLADKASQDVGLSLTQLVTSYGQGLTNAGIVNPLGKSRPLTAFGRTLLDVFREVAKEYDCAFWVDPTTSVVYLIPTASFTAADLIIARGEIG